MGDHGLPRAIIGFPWFATGKHVIPMGDHDIPMGIRGIPWSSMAKPRATMAMPWKTPLQGMGMPWFPMAGHGIATDDHGGLPRTPMAFP